MSEATATATPPPNAPPADRPTLDAPAATEKAPADFMADIVGDFESMDAGKPAPERDDKGKFVKPADKPQAKPEAAKPKPEEAAKPKDEVKPAEDDTPPKPVKAAELRTAYEGLKKKLAEAEPELQRLRAKVKEFEGQKPAEDTATQEVMKRLQGEVERLEQRIAFTDYSQSREFREKYNEPFRRAWDEAVTEFKELTIKQAEGEDEMGEPKYVTRPANEQDLLTLANMRLSDMDEAANRMFGASAARAITHIQNIRRLSNAKHKALEEARTKAGEWTKQQMAEHQRMAKTLADTWQDVNKGLQEKFPKAYTPEDGNAEDKAGHTKGFALADLLFLGPEALNPEQVEALPSGFKDAVKSKKPLTEVQKVQLHAIARLKMANHDRQLVRLKAASAKIKELEQELAQYKSSEPHGGESRRSGERSTSKDWLQEAEDELKAMDRG